MYKKHIYIKKRDNYEITKTKWKELFPQEETQALSTLFMIHY